jgi:hypothetical protein
VYKCCNIVKRRDSWLLLSLNMPYYLVLVRLLLRHGSGFYSDYFLLYFLIYWTLSGQYKAILNAHYFHRQVVKN